MQGLRIALIVLLLAGGAIAAQSDLPPVSYVCPMSEHSEVVENGPGKCPRCQMVLVPVRIDLAWSCTTHAAVIADKPGICPLDKRDLVQVAVARYWTCGNAPNDHLIDPGKCADGTPRKMVREARAHGDHNPKHGGQFFMAGDKWHHIEATYPSRGLVRVFFYDNFTQPLAVKAVTGRAVTREESDSTGKSREVAAAALRPSADGKTLEARITETSMPLKVSVKVKFDAKSSEERFDFTFADFSKDPVAVVARAPAAPPKLATVPKPAATPAQLPPAVPFATSLDFASEALPAAPDGLFTLLDARGEDVRMLIEKGEFGAVYVPAMRCKDVALALEEQASGFPDARRLRAAEAVRRIVLAAWQLDAFGDTGNREKLTAAYSQFATAVADLKASYARP